MRAHRPLRRRWPRRLGLLVLAILLLPVGPILTLRWATPPTTAFMLRTGGPVDYDWRNREDISPELAWAVLSSEDQKFLRHFGFDLASIRDAVDDYRAGQGIRGASTITQQVAKNLFLWPGQDFLRKGIEAYLTLIIEACWTKERILEVYLNVAEFGEGIFGAEAAARRIFGSTAADLSRAEAALLAAVLPSPKRFRAHAPSAHVRARQAWILAQMPRVRSGRNLTGWERGGRKGSGRPLSGG